MVHSSARVRAPASVFIVMSFSGINKRKDLTTLMLLKHKEKSDSFLQKGPNNRKQNVVKSFKVCLRFDFPCLGMLHGGLSFQTAAFKSILGTVRL